MKLKSFIIGSVVIHTLGGLILYFYYNPIQIGHKLVKEHLATDPPLSSRFKKDLNPAIKRKQKTPKAFLKKKPVQPASPYIEKSFEETKTSSLNRPRKSFTEEEQPAPESLNPEEADSELEDLGDIEEAPSREGGFSDEATLLAIDSQEDHEGRESLRPKDEARDQTRDQTKDEARDQENLGAPAEDIERPSVEEGDIKEELPEESAEEAMETGLEIKNPEEADIELEEVEGESFETEKQSLELDSQELGQELGQNSNQESSRPQSILELSAEKEIDFSKLKQKPGNPAIYYPDFARREGMEGRLVVRFFVDANGFVDQMKLEGSSGHTKLDNFILRLLSSYQFEDKEVWTRFDQSFKLEGEEKEFLRLKKAPL